MGGRLSVGGLSTSCDLAAISLAFKPHGVLHEGGGVDGAVDVVGSSIGTVY